MEQIWNQLFVESQAYLPWYWAGTGIALVMLALLWLGESFGISSNFRTICAMTGIGRRCDFFDIDWRHQNWNLSFLLGSMVGGFLAYHFMYPEASALNLSQATQELLLSMGINPQQGFYPMELLSLENLGSPAGIVMTLVGGFLVGFGARWAGGCTSGHAISGLSNLQLPSLIAVVGFFIGGLISTYLIIPFLLG
ncbi:hypothetical protein FHS56_001427 [Thermonema lapsum]|uniref:YeeE/YedE family protein n=1 Tax=Thermonema lapsum TaxID=28195 RepID=A0A846MQQ0_9BACT|nr:YeeE/YedE thiosulfate transporter family protein [Thermonema lapsum]NIK73914.1 hypothetical protein [Thermonema lapsum]